MVEPTLRLIDLDQELPGQREFISCWVWQQAELTFIVDPGPGATAGRLVAQLRALQVDHLDYILLTHVHLDHAGGTAQVLTAYPEAKVVCHEKGVPHLLDPAGLWRGSRKVLGRMAEVYGEPEPVPAAALAGFAEIAARGVETFPTPGHAAHHLCFLHAGTLFCGEVAGTYLAMTNGDYYLRPATPPRFILAPALSSLERLLDIEPPPQRLAFAHHGLADDAVTDLLQTARDQLLHWVRVARQEGGKDPASFDDLLAQITARLLEEDPHFGLLERLAPAIQERERQFAVHSLAGILGYIDSAY